MEHGKIPFLGTTVAGDPYKPAAYCLVLEKSGLRSNAAKTSAAQLPDPDAGTVILSIPRGQGIAQPRISGWDTCLNYSEASESTSYCSTAIRHLCPAIHE